MDFSYYWVQKTFGENEGPFLIKKNCIGLIFKVYLLHFGPVSSGRLPDLPGPKLSNKKKDIAWSFSHQESALSEQK